MKLRRYSPLQAATPLHARGAVRPECASAAAGRIITLDEWQAFVEDHPGSGPFHHRAWIELLVHQYGLRPRIVAVHDRDGRILAGLPFLQSGGTWRRPIWRCLPFTDCMRALTTTLLDQDLLREAIGQVSSDACRLVLLVTAHPFSSHACPSGWVRHELDLSVPLEQIERQFPGPLVRNLRKAEKGGLQWTRRHDPQALDEFYDLHLRTRRKLGVPVQPRGFFRRLQEEIVARGLGFVAVVSQEERPLAAAVFLVYKSVVIYKYGASEPEALECRPNEWLMYHAIRWAAQSGHARFDFGVSQQQQEGLRRYKRKWGAVESIVYHDYFRGSGRPTGDDSWALKAAAAIIRRSPPLVCRALGEMLYRYRY
jgi:CelD/BcsL family acetyltransferase involved in cellulose biosynthesis